MGAARPKRSILASLIATTLFTVGLLLPSTPASAATITVNTFADQYDEGPECSLREASVAASTNSAFGGCPAGDGDDTIMLAAGTYQLTIPDPDDNESVYGDVDFWDGDKLQGIPSVTVQGAGMDATIIDGGSEDNVDDRVFHTRGISATFADLTVRDGRPLYYCDPGAGIYAEGGEQEGPMQVTVLRSSVHKNDTCSYGGGVATGGGNAPTLNITDSEIANNHVYEPEGGGDGDGGGIWTSGPLNVSNSSVRDNYAFDHGGGIKAYGNGPFAITNSRITGNETVMGGGGGMYIGTDGTITDSTIDGNINLLNGGGLYIDCCQYEVSITDTTISNNEAILGGGIYNLNYVSNFKRHAADAAVPLNDGPELTNVTVSSNLAAFGGGIQSADSGVMFLNHVTVYRNHAEGVELRPRGEEASAASFGPGGGISDMTSNTVYHTNSIVAGNTPDDCSGSVFSGGGGVVGPNCNSGPEDVTDVIDPGLGTLKGNGGLTFTHKVLPGSPAIDNASGSAMPCPAADQRGLVRPTGAACDSGAYEVGDLPGGAVVGGAVIIDQRCRKKDPTILGTPGDDTLIGTPGADVIQGLEGRDTINGLGGNDVICGARNNDTMKGGAGNDIIKGHRGIDHYMAGAGDDLCIPGPGDDVYEDCESPPQTT